MYIAMNRFQIAEGREEVFEEIWRKRDSQLESVPGFVEFRLLRGGTEEGATLFASHTTWETEQAFRDWTDSDNFRKAHTGAAAPKGTYLAHPRFEGFEVIL